MLTITLALWVFVGISIALWELHECGDALLGVSNADENGSGHCVLAERVSGERPGH